MIQLNKVAVIIHKDKVSMVLEGKEVGRNSLPRPIRDQVRLKRFTSLFWFDPLAYRAP